MGRALVLCVGLLAALCVAIGCGAYMIATALQHNPLLAARGAL